MREELENCALLRGFWVGLPVEGCGKVGGIRARRFVAGLSAAGALEFVVTEPPGIPPPWRIARCSSRPLLVLGE